MSVRRKRSLGYNVDCMGLNRIGLSLTGFIQDIEIPKVDEKAPGSFGWPLGRSV